MSLLTINKLTDSVGAEVTGIDPDRLASDDLLGEAVLDALERNGVLVFRGLNLAPLRRPPPGIRHLPDHAGQVEERLRGLPARHLRLAHRRMYADQ